MNPQFQTSFIPKKPITAAPGGIPKAINLFALLAIILFLVALALSGGVFFYKNLLNKQISQAEKDLELAREAFDPALINKVVRVNTRLETGKKLLSSHVAVTPFFNFLSKITLKSVRFKDFDFSYLANDKIEVSMSGEAKGYSSVALQSDVLNEQKLLKDTIVSDMTLESDGKVSFKVSTVVDSSLTSYAAEYVKSATSTSGMKKSSVTATSSKSQSTTTQP